MSLNAAYTFGHSYNVFDGSSSVAYSNWKYNSNTNSYSPLAVSSIDVDDSGVVTPTFSYSATGKYLDDYYSRWRMQLGIRVTF